MKAIAKEDGIAGFPSHLRVLHVRQEIPALKDEVSVLQAVIDADVERTMLLQEEKELLAKLEGAEAAEDDSKLSVQAKREKLLKGAKAADNNNNNHTNANFEKDLKELDEVYERLQSLGSDAAEAKAAMILSGLQFTPEMQSAAITSLSGGWQMRVALAAALFVEPDICLLVRLGYYTRTVQFVYRSILFVETEPKWMILCLNVFVTVCSLSALTTGRANEPSCKYRNLARLFPRRCCFVRKPFSRETLVCCLCSPLSVGLGSGLVVGDLSSKLQTHADCSQSRPWFLERSLYGYH